MNQIVLVLIGVYVLERQNFRLMYLLRLEFRIASIENVVIEIGAYFVVKDSLRSYLVKVNQFEGYYCYHDSQMLMMFVILNPTIDQQILRLVFELVVLLDRMNVSHSAKEINFSVSNFIIRF